MNLDKFFAYARRSPFGGSLSQARKDNSTLIINYALSKNLPLIWIAYILATAFHETDGTMRPILENLNYKTPEVIRATWPTRFPTVDSAKPYVKQPQKLANLVYAGRNGNTDPNDGWTWRGAGYVQLTGKGNAAKFGITNPADLLKPDVATRILVEGMVTGVFTGKRLADYGKDVGVFNATNARAIVNGNVKAALIATYCAAFYDALQAAQDAPVAALADIPADVPTPAAALVDASAARPDDVSLVDSPIARYAGGLLASGGGISAIAGISNPWAFAFLAFIIGIVAIFAWGYFTGRIHLKHHDV